MALIGRQLGSLSDRVVLDNIAVTTTDTFNLLLNGVAFVPNSAEALTVSLNGIIQKPQGSYTVSGSQIIFSSSLTSGTDVIDFIIAERAITLQTPSAGSVGTSQLADSAVTTAKLNNGAVTTGKLASQTQGDILYFGSSGTPALLSAGTNGQVLTTGGAGANPSWSTISSAEYSIAHTSTTTNRTLSGDSGWVDHLSVSFTTTQTCTIQCLGQFSHGYESGAVFTAGRFVLDSSSISDELQVFKQGIGANMAFGSHNMIGFFTSVSAGSHTIVLQLRNSGGGTTAITNYFDNANNGDHIWILYK